MLIFKSDFRKVKKTRELSIREIKNAAFCDMFACIVVGV